MNEREALKLALEALEIEYRMYEATDPETGAPYNMIQAITAIKEALVQPEQNPVASVYISHHKGLENRDFDYWGSLPDGSHNLYTIPPQRTWVGLTGKEVAAIFTSVHTWHERAEAIEAKLKEKNT